MSVGERMGDSVCCTPNGGSLGPLRACTYVQRSEYKTSSSEPSSG